MVSEQRCRDTTTDFFPGADQAIVAGMIHRSFSSVPTNDTCGQISSSVAEAFSQVLDTYERMGDNLPLLGHYRDFFLTEPHMVQILQQMYRDILDFHRIALEYFQQPGES